MPVLRTKTSRMWLPDALRGLALLNMLAYHAMYDWVYVFGHESSWYNIWAPGCHVWQQYICWSFILLSGFSFPLAKRPAKNGLIVAGCAAVLTFVTAVFMPSEAIWFGVLHLNAAAVLLTCLVYPLLQRLPAGAGLAASAALFVLTNQLPEGYLGFENWRLCAVPAGLYRQGRAARRAASSVCHRSQYAAGLHAASARNLRCAVGVAHGAGVKGPKYEQYKNFHFSENCC